MRSFIVNKSVDCELNNVSKELNRQMLLKLIRTGKSNNLFVCGNGRVVCLSPYSGGMLFKIRDNRLCYLPKSCENVIDLLKKLAKLDNLELKPVSFLIRERAVKNIVVYNFEKQIDDSKLFKNIRIQEETNPLSQYEEILRRYSAWDRELIMSSSTPFVYPSIYEVSNE